MQNRNDNMDLFDRLFEQLEHDQSSLSEFKTIISDSMNETARKKGYDTFAQMISSEVLHGMTDKQPRKPQVDIKNMNTENCSRYEYMLHSIASIQYEPKYQGYYEAGHQQCLNYYQNQMSEKRNELCDVEIKIKQEIKEYGRLVKKNREDAFTQGYYDALVLLSDSLLRSKKAKMREVKQAITKMKG